MTQVPVSSPLFLRKPNNNFYNDSNVVTICGLAPSTKNLKPLSQISFLFPWDLFYLKTYRDSLRIFSTRDMIMVQFDYRHRIRINHLRPLPRYQIQSQFPVNNKFLWNISLVENESRGSSCTIRSSNSFPRLTQSCHPGSNPFTEFSNLGQPKFVQLKTHFATGKIVAASGYQTLLFWLYFRYTPGQVFRTTRQAPNQSPSAAILSTSYNPSEGVATKWRTICASFGVSFRRKSGRKIRVLDLEFYATGVGHAVLDLNAFFILWTKLQLALEGWKIRVLVR